MTKESVKKITPERLISHKKGHKVILVALLAVAIALLFFPIYGMMNGQEFDMSEFVIPLCTIGGAISVWMEMSIINKELATRNP